MKLKEMFIGLAVIVLGGCANPQNPISPEVAKSVAQRDIEQKPPRPKAKPVNIPFPYELHPQIARITLREERPDSMDRIEYDSMTAILSELDKRRAQLQVTGVFCQFTDKRCNDREGFGDLHEYCEENDIDLFCSYPLGLPSFDNLLNIHWILQSSQTKYALPESSTNTIE
jgi:hypothetical protein